MPKWKILLYSLCLALGSMEIVRPVLDLFLVVIQSAFSPIAQIQ